MDAGGPVAFRRELELRAERGFLALPREARFPAVEPDLADARARVRVEQAREVRPPVGRLFVDIPRVHAEARVDEVGMAAGEIRDGGPVADARPVDDHADDAGSAGRAEEVVLAAGEPLILQVIMRVAKADHLNQRRHAA